jgi:hypothetical protein
MKRQIVIIPSLALAATTILLAQVSDVIAARDAFASTGTTGDKIARAAFLADDLTWVDRGGRLRNKQAELEEFMPGGTTRASEVDARPYGSAAVLVSRLGTADKNLVIAIGVWQRVEKAWVLLAVQNTQVGGVPPNPDRRPSSALPTDKGEDTDIRAVQTLVSEIQTAARNRNGRAFVGLVTPQFLWVSAAGEVRTAGERSAEIQSGVLGSDALLRPEAQSRRVYGDLALINSVLRDSDSRRFRRLQVVVKQQGGWRAAADITTPVAVGVN